MKCIVFSSITLLSILAAAHIKVGTYTGVDQNNKPCSAEVEAVAFAFNIANPLNERVSVKLQGASFELRHQPIVSDTSAEISFEKGILRAANGTRDGAVSASLYMVHTPDYEGPGRFVVNTHNWQTNSSTSFECQNLRK